MRVRKKSELGIGLVEAVVSLAVFTIGLVGVIEMQLVASRQAVMARRVAQASALAHDLAENAALWPYDDPRLAAQDNITAPTAPVVTDRSADTRDDLITASANKPHYAEEATTNALNPSALRSATLPYDGLTAPPDFERYWNVFSLDQNGDGTPDGKLVQVIVRWKEPGLGWRRLVQTTFRANPGSFSL